MRRDYSDICIRLIHIILDEVEADLDEKEKVMYGIRDDIHEIASPITHVQMRASMAVRRQAQE